MALEKMIVPGGECRFIDDAEPRYRTDIAVAARDVVAMAALVKE
ncbi:hypothetical protein B0G57_11292 [Trinickia symbiotica]|nr:hypothetical protein [Trinickia symbiotica]PPK43545.1 hypothetical protein B0G57_11292 [Trinickia symbiotica]